MKIHKSQKKILMKTAEALNAYEHDMLLRFCSHFGPASAANTIYLYKQVTYSVKLLL